MAKAVAFVLVMIMMVSTFTVQANAVDVTGSGRSLLHLRFFTDIKEATTGEVVAAPVASLAEALAPSENEEKKGQTWVSWFGYVSCWF